MGPATTAWTRIAVLICVQWPVCAAVLSFAVEDTAGVHHSTAELGGYRGAVFAFVANQCPVSNSYAPELARLYRQYASRGIAFFAVHSDPAESVDAIRGHAREFGFAFPVLLDRDQSLARAAGATSTLEVVVAARDGRVLYRGRLD